MDTSDRVVIYRWPDAPTTFRGRFTGERRDFIAHVPKGCTLRPTHFARRLEDVVERGRRDGSTLVAGNEPEPGEEA